jgi:predicted DNA-binding transcriptional regulator AlpA
LSLKKRITTLPDSLPPRGLSREQAAEYIGAGTSLFDRMISDGRMPRPKRIDGRTVWDRVQLDKAFAALPGDEERHPYDDLWTTTASKT